jgi:hypothetical protein
VLGVYLIGRGQGLRAAPIDIKTGEFISNGALRPINGRSITEVAEVTPEPVPLVVFSNLFVGCADRERATSFSSTQAVRDVDLYFKWDGNVGLGLPGYISPESGCVPGVYPPANCVP